MSVVVIDKGFHGFYKGVLHRCIWDMPKSGFSSFGYCLGKQLQKPCTTSTYRLSIVQHGLAGGMSGVFTTMVSAVEERIKCEMQAQKRSKGAAKYSSSFDCAVKLCREGGVRNIYKGTVPVLVREVLSGACLYGSYELLMRMSAPEKGEQDLSVARTLIAGGVAGMASSLVCKPADVAKSRFQTAMPGRYKHIGSVYLELIRERRLAALYKGMTPVVLRAFPVNAAAFLGFEVTVKVLAKLSNARNISKLQ